MTAVAQGPAVAAPAAVTAVTARSGGGGAVSAVAAVSAAGGRAAVCPVRPLHGRNDALTASATLATTAHFTAVATVTAGTLVHSQSRITSGPAAAVTRRTAVAGGTAVAGLGE